MPRVSVAVITYNQLPLLKECLASVLAQELPPGAELEVVVADDGSKDGTAAYLRGLARRDPRVVPVLARRNQGITANSNAALRACTGDYVAWMGGDDVMRPGKLARQLAAMEADPSCSLCYHDAELFDGATGRTLGHSNSGPFGRKPHRDARSLLRRSRAIVSSTVMTRASAHPPGGYDARVRVASDWLFWVEVALRGRILFIPEPLVRYRQHAGQVTGRVGYLEDFLVSMAILETRYPRLRRAVRKRRARSFFHQGFYDAVRRRSVAGMARSLFAAIRVDPIVLTQLGGVLEGFVPRVRKYLRAGRRR